MSKLVLDDYGWQRADSGSTGYLAPHVRRVCRRLRPDKVLDLGCGNGSLTKVLVQECPRVWGCDADEGGLQLAAQNVPEACFKKVSLYEDPEHVGEKDFDLIVSCEVIEHLFLPRHLAAFAKALLKPGGHLLVTTPYHAFLKNLAIALLNRWDRHHGVLDDGGHVKFFSRRTLTRLLEEEGFEVVSFAGAGRLPYLWKSMVLLARLA